MRDANTLPVLLITPFEVSIALEGRDIAMRLDDGTEVIMRRATAEDVMQMHITATENLAAEGFVDNDTPRMSVADAERIAGPPFTRQLLIGRTHA